MLNQFYWGLQKSTSWSVLGIEEFQALLGVEAGLIAYLFW